MIPKSERLTKKDFIGLRPKIVFRGTYIDMATAEGLSLKFSCIISKKRLKRAVERNRVRRKIYSAIGVLKLKQPRYILLYPKQTVISGQFSNIKEELHKAFATLQ